MIELSFSCLTLFEFEMNVVFFVCCDGDTNSREINPGGVVWVNANTSNYLVCLLLNNGQTIEARCAHSNDWITHKENKELYFIVRLKPLHLHIICKHLLNHKMFDMELPLINEGFKILDFAIINMLFETGISRCNLRIENIELKYLFDNTLFEATKHRLLEMDSHFVAHKSASLLISKTIKQFTNESKMSMNNSSTTNNDKTIW